MTRPKLNGAIANVDRDSGDRARLPPPPLALLRNASLFLDFDGTLVDLAERPDAVRVDRSLRELIVQLHMRLSGRVVLISGRSAGAVRELIGYPACTVIGSHGMEFAWADGRPHFIPRPEGLDDALAAMRTLELMTPGVLVEDKPLGAALHFRGAPAAEAVCVALATELAAAYGLHLQHGKKMVEVRASGGDKGSAVATMMAEPNFAATRPVFIGDDLTDESGFAAAAALNGAGVLVGVRAPSAASYALPYVAAVRDWLALASEAAQ